jgi:hypothetical protein
MQLNIIKLGELINISKHTPTSQHKYLSQSIIQRKQYSNNTNPIQTYNKDNFFFLIGKRSILLKKCKAPLSTLEVYRENTYLEIEKRVTKTI